MKLTPIANRIIVKKDEAKAVTESGLYIPDEYQEAPNIGQVIAVGEGIYNGDGIKVRPILVKEGDKVLFGKYAGTQVEIEGQALLLMIEEDILCIVES